MAILGWNVWGRHTAGCCSHQGAASAGLSTFLLMVDMQHHWEALWSPRVHLYTEAEPPPSSLPLGRDRAAALLIGSSPLIPAVAMVSSPNHPSYYPQPCLSFSHLAPSPLLMSHALCPLAGNKTTEPGHSETPLFHEYIFFFFLSRSQKIDK